MHFALRLADGMLVESSFDDEPVSFVVGDGTLDRGLELALLGLVADARQTLSLMPGQAFGMRDEAALQQVQRAQFPEDILLEQGQIVGFSSEDGEELAGAIIEIGDEQVKVDFNHPLAGREIEFEVHILAVENPPAG
ncbi:MAG: FKBP-type peptidyl-prolyl cis-trans isomerase [Gammaproteobacteria bacterium]|nr:MAG: FKBP-type peptidyl-prolyl cis-trans isomerase [Gammaproteobacteria bacterium]